MRAWLRDRARSQSRSQQTNPCDAQRPAKVIHVLVIATIEETELLLPVRWIVGGINIQQDLSPLRTCSPQIFTNQSSRASCSLRRSRGEGEFSQRLRVGCDPRVHPAVDRQESETPDRDVTGRRRWRLRSQR